MPEARISTIGVDVPWTCFSLGNRSHVFLPTWKEKELTEKEFSICIGVPNAILYKILGYPPFVSKNSSNPESLTTFLINLFITITWIGGFFTIGDTQKIKEFLGHTSRAIFVKNPIGKLVSGPNKCRKWVALIVDKNK